ncbi:SPOR domain-containing protein [Silvibacterium sp.]|uniref:SPOR domain-containing protein n=1 Tax=Silvibacterium sp. TaxID=1964179 RepID=UPI0039E5CADC
MRSILEDEEEDIRHSDTEITLGIKSLLGVFFGAVLVCGVFFGLGYSMGRGSGRAAQEAASSAGSSSTAKQSAGEDSGSAPLKETIASADGSSPASDTNSETSSTASPEASEPATKPGAAVAGNPAYDYVPTPNGPARRPAGAPVAGDGTSSVHAAKPSAGVEETAPQRPAAQPAAVQQASLQAVPTPPVQQPHAQPAALTTTTAPAGAGTIMVQIAAVSRNEDASILVGALKKHGYNATMRTDPRDNLVHVQVGPFASKDEARAMRSRLLADGYNAILK